MRAASAGSAAIAVIAITLVCATSAADTVGALPSCLVTLLFTGALVTSSSSVCTTVGVTDCCGLFSEDAAASRLDQDLRRRRVLLGLGDRQGDADP